MVIFFVAAGRCWSVVRSRERGRPARPVPRRRLVAWILAWLGRTEHPDIVGSIHKFQASLGEIVYRRGLAASAMTTVAQIPWCIAFIVGTSHHGRAGRRRQRRRDHRGLSRWSSIITIIPIAPGGAGVPELLYIAGLTTIAGPSWKAVITAGVFLFRLYDWFLPIPLAWILLKIVRRGLPMLPTTAELKSFASAGTGVVMTGEGDEVEAVTSSLPSRRKRGSDRSSRTGYGATRTCSRRSSRA